MSTVQIRYDPFDADIQDDPYPAYRLMRNEVPVYRAEASNTWVLSRHDDVSAALLDHHTYSSVNGVFPTPPDAPFLESFLPMMIMMDPPRHDQLRALVSRAFTLGALLPSARVSSSWPSSWSRNSTACGTVDFVADFAGILPAMVIADLLGVPREDRTQFRQWSSTLIQSNPARGEVGKALLPQPRYMHTSPTSWLTVVGRRVRI